MGWAQEHLSHLERRDVATTLFEVSETRGDWLHGLCPFHQDSEPSFAYNFVKDVFVCNAQCTESGDLIKLFALVHGLDDREGFIEFRKRYVDGAAKKRTTPGRRTEPARRAALQPQSQGEENRGFAEDEFSNITVPLPDSWRERLRAVRGWSDDEMDTLGIRLQVKAKNKKGELFALKVPERVAMPVRDATGRIKQIRLYRPFKKEGSTGPKIFSWGKGSGHPELYPQPQYWMEGRIYVVEGEGDAVCGRSKGLNCVGQTGKPNRWPKEFSKHFAGRDVVIVPDADQPGLNYARKAAQNLAEVAASVSILEWPDFMGRERSGEWPKKHGQDLTDYFVLHGGTAAGFLDLADKAKPVELKPRPSSGAAPDEVDLEAEPWLKFFAASSASGRYSFRQRLLADELLADGPYLWEDESGSLYHWNGKFFEEFSEAQWRRKAIELLGPEAEDNRIRATVSIARDMAAMPHGRELNDRPGWVCLQNGMFNLMTLKLEPHDPDFMASYALPVSWDPENVATPTRWVKFLEETIQTPEVIQQAEEFIGLCLTRSTKYGKALLLHGPGSDGKSKFVQVVEWLVGDENRSSVPIEGLEDQFQRVAIRGKLINVGTEINEAALSSSYFKAIVTGDSINASFKHKDGFSFNPFAKLIYACNELPRVLDNSDGFFRRVLPIAFKRQFMGEDIQLDLEDELRAELQGIFHRAVYALHRLEDQGCFTHSDETEDFILSYRRYNSPVMAFVMDSCDVAESLTEKTTDLYKAFRRYASENGYRAMNKERFIKQLETAARKIRAHAVITQRRPKGEVGPDGKMQRPFRMFGIALQNSARASLLDSM